MKSFVTIAIMFNLAALAELPPSLDDVLFSMTGGTNYVAWMATEGEIAFRKPFSLFGSARFQSFHPTNDASSLHYSITMEKRFYGVANPSNIIESLKQAEGALQKQFEQRFLRRRDNTSYQSKCIDIDGLGWDASFCVEQVSDENATATYIAKAVFYNPLRKEGRFVSCEDFFNKCETNQHVKSDVTTDESATFNTIDSILLQAISYRKAKDHYPEFGLIEIPISASIKRGHILDQYGREIRYNVTRDTLEVRSSGKDGVFGTDDDIIGAVSPDQTGRHINGKFETFALEVEP